MIILLLIFLTLSIFSIARILLYIIYFRKPRPLTTGELLFALKRGLRFDLSVFSTIFGLPILLAFLPFEFTTFVHYQAVVYTLWFILLSIVLAVTTGDLLYFKYVNRHITNEIRYLFSERGVIIRILSSSYRAQALLGLTFFLAAGYMWYNSLHPHSAQVTFPGYGPAMLRFLLTSLLLVYFIHGNGLSGKPIAQVDANARASREQAAMIMNGLFSALHSLYRSRKRTFVEITDSGEAIKNILTATSADNGDPKFPMLCEHLAGSAPLFKKPLNMVLIVIEGFSSHNIPTIFEEAKSPWSERGVMPFVDRLASDSMLFPNFFSNGQRTLDMVHTLLTSIPRIGESPLIGYGRDFSGVNFKYLPQLLRTAGYTARCFNGPWEKSIRMDSIASLTGFDRYHHGSEINQTCLKKSGIPGSKVGAWDEHLFDFAYRRLRESDGPDFSLIFTATSHAPYQLPERESKPFGESDDLHKYFNCNRYLDSVLRDFFRKTDSDPHFEDTLFFITGDHTIFPLSGEWETTSLFHTPLLIHNKKHIAPGLNRRVGSHMDLLPTLLHVSGFSGKMVSFGRSLLGETGRDFSIMSQGNTIHSTDGKTWIIHPDILSTPECFKLRNGYFLKRVESPCPPDLVKLTESYYQATNSLFMENRYYPPV